MPKIKTRKSVAKRFRFTATRKIRRAQANRRHLMSHRSSKRKRHLGKGELVSPSEEKKIQRLLPWG